MRYADQPGTDREVHISAEPSRVWEVVTDVEAMAGWSPELVRVEWQDGADRPAPGARYVGHNQNPFVGEWRTLAHITEAVPERSLSWCVLDPDGRYGRPSEDEKDRMSTWSFVLTPAPEGGTVLRQSVTIGPGRSGLSAYIDRAPDQEEAIIAYRLDQLGQGMDATLTGIKETAERRS
ncbi:SRPBCC family protein [Streptomyces sp. NPDC056165]|uniref:SRPBCC family protein n=1 Tax=Streptomyces sp. NPDC056165 TaxID=3345733 RepID=UPI0035E38D95